MGPDAMILVFWMLSFRLTFSLSSFTLVKRLFSSYLFSAVKGGVICICEVIDIQAPQFSSVQSLSCVRLFATPWIAACQASLSITNSQSLLKLMLIESVMPSSHLILCRPLLLLSPVPPRIRVYSNESTLHMSGQSIGVSASASVLPMNTQDWSPSGWTGWISLQSNSGS